MQFTITSSEKVLVPWEDKTMSKETQIAIILSIAVLLLGIGVSDRTLLTQNEYVDAYVCSVNKQVMIFPGGISGTGYTGYPIEGSRAGYKRCKEEDLKGVWINLEEYSLSAGIDPLIFLESLNNEKKLLQYLCNQEDCFELT